MPELLVAVSLDGSPLSPSGRSGEPGPSRLPGRVELPDLRLSASASSSTPDGALWLALDGRIDNRDVLAARLGLDPPSGVDDDAALALAGFLAWGDDLVASIVGPFALVVVDRRERAVRLARDPLGGRTLFHRRMADRLIIGNRASAVARAFGSTARPDETSVVRYLALDGPVPGASFFAGVDELEPGALQRIDRAGARRLRSDALRPDPDATRGRERDLEEILRARLEEAVLCRMPRAAPTSILLSGGLDSASIASTAARLAAATGAAPPLAVSWLLPGLPGCDESPWIRPLTASAHLRAIELDGRGHGPFTGDPPWPTPLDAPFQDPYLRLREAALARARGEGSPVVLTGDGGDHLWSGGRDWLRDLVLTGRWAAAAAGLAAGFAHELRGRRTSFPPRHSIGRLISHRRRPGGRLEPAGWLTEEALQMLPPQDADDATSTAVEERRRAIVYPYDSSAQRAGLVAAEEAGAEIRRPYRDRRLVELFLALPARCLYRPGQTKRILRRAFRERLPEKVRQRREHTDLLPLFDAALFDDGYGRVEAELAAADAIWPHLVRREAIEAQLRSPASRSLHGRLVLWHCLCLERWRRALGALSEPCLLP